MAQKQKAHAPIPKTQSYFPTQYVICAILIILCSYQYHVNLSLKSKLLDLQTKLDKTHGHVSNLADSNIPEPEATIYPHSHYDIDHIPESKLTPRDIYREYTYDDFVSVFHVEPLHKLIVTQPVLDLIKNHDVTKDNFYVDNPDLVNYLIQNYGEYLRQESLEALDRY